MGAAFTASPYIAVFLVVREILQSDPSMGRIVLFALGGLAGVVGRYVLLALGNSLAHVVAFQVEHDLRLAMADKMGRLPLGYFTSRSLGEVRRSLNEDVLATHGLIAHYINDVTSSVFAPVVIGSFLIAVDWRLGLVAAGFIPLALFAYSRQYGRGLRDRLQTYQNLRTDVSGAVVDYINGMRVAKAYNQSAHYFSRLVTATSAQDEWVKDLNRTGRFPWTSFEVLITANLLLMLPVATWLHLEHALSLEVAILFLIAGPALTAPMMRVVYVLFGAMREMQSVAAAARLLGAEELPEPAVPRVPADNTVELKNVSFRYGSDLQLVVDGASFVAREGEVTALVGPSGAGKTTIARLIPRFWDVTSGSIEIGGVDIRDMSSDELLSRISFVFQDVFLLDSSIAENIRNGRPGATDEEVMAAAEAARVMEFARDLPGGLDFAAGEKGVRLSAGEKQRIAVARALLKDAPILVLDEATASADADNEAAIQEALSILAANRTVIVIAHRLTSVADADNIVMLEAGRVTGTGQIGHLLRENAGFRRLWDAQQDVAEWALDLSGGVRV